MSKITLLQSYDSPILLESDSEGIIYRISDKFVAKVGIPTYGTASFSSKYEKRMFYEIKIARLLYSLGISVPEPIMCDYVRVDDDVRMAYIMEFIDGKAYDDETISDKDLTLAKKLVDKEMKLSSKLGFTILQEAPQWIFTKDKKIKLIDFTEWKYKGL